MPQTELAASLLRLPFWEQLIMTSHEVRTRLTVVFLLFLAAAEATQSQASKATSKDRKPEIPKDGTPVLWVDPGESTTRNLLYGPGSADLAPAPPFTFVEEDKSGTQPKFTVTDQRGTEWNVKLGIEAQSETASTRLVWAAGYFAEESYYLPEARIQNMVTLSRKTDEIKPGGVVTNARFEPSRPEMKKIGEWEWEENPFLGTRELDGLKVVMMLLNNWDAHDTNNRIVHVAGSGATAENRYMVSDLGATLGKAGGAFSHTKSDVKDYAESDFVKGVEQGIVKFHYSVRPKGLGMFAIIYPPYASRVADISDAMKGIKVAHARWIGGILARLSDQQLRDAFTAAGYDEPTIAGYVSEVRERIQQLTSLPDVLTARY
jgi:hypothetical protein